MGVGTDWCGVFLLFAYFTGTGLKALFTQFCIISSGSRCGFLKSNPSDRITNLFPCVFQLTSLKESYSFDEEEVVFQEEEQIKLYQSPIPDTKEAVPTSKTKRNKWARRSEALAYEDSCFNGVAR
ncbi:hypothetical protein ACJX0J_002224 (mitochondrion) [Zea mays]